MLNIVRKMSIIDINQYNKCKNGEERVRMEVREKLSLSENFHRLMNGECEGIRMPG